MAGVLKVDTLNADSNLALKIANTAVAYIDSTGLKPVSGNLTLGGTQVATNGALLGSAISANTIANTAIQTGAIENYLNASGGSLTGRNKIINGAMTIDQRNAGASVTQDTVANYTVDRFFILGNAASKFTAQQNAGSVTPPAGFVNYLGCTSSSAYTAAAGEAFTIQQRIEGYNVADLNLGTANAKTVTLSFWVRSSLTGNFGGSLKNANIGTRSYPFSYAISAANTWEQKSITIAGDTSGTWVTGNTSGLVLVLSLGAGSTFSGTAGAWADGNFQAPTGSTSVVGTSGATFYITGVQLEAGSTPTPFEYRQYGSELQLCQRYYYKIIKGDGNSRVLSGYNISTTQSIYVLNMPISMRTSPTALQTNGTAAHYSVAHVNTETNCSAVPSYNDSTINTVSVIGAVASGLTAGQGCQLRLIDASSYLAVSAEL